MKTRILWIFVALSLAFSACQKDAPAAAPDDDGAFDASIKGYAKLDPNGGEDEGASVAFKWNAITASDFAKGATPPFNNWSKPLGDGIVVYRAKPGSEATIKAGIMNLKDGQTGTAFLENLQATNKQAFGNGNDPVFIWFDLIDITKQILDKKSKVDLKTSITVLVRYRASNNVAFEFNLWKAAAYCFLFGPISLDCTVIGRPDLGEVTQVRIQGPEKGSIEKPKKPKPDDPEPKPPVDPDPDPIDVCFVLDVVNQKDVIECADPIYLDDDCTILVESVYEDIIEKVVLSANQFIDGWEYSIDSGDFDTFEFGVTEVCDGDVEDVVLLKPVIKTKNTIEVCVVGVDVEGGKKCKDLTAIDECPTLTWGEFEDIESDAIVFENKEFVGWLVTYTDVSGNKVVDEEFNKNSNIQSCEDITIRPQYINVIEVCIEGVVVPQECQTIKGTVDDCPVLTWSDPKVNLNVAVIEDEKHMFTGKWFVKIGDDKDLKPFSAASGENKYVSCYDIVIIPEIKAIKSGGYDYVDGSGCLNNTPGNTAVFTFCVKEKFVFDDGSFAKYGEQKCGLTVWWGGQKPSIPDAHPLANLMGNGSSSFGFGGVNQPDPVPFTIPIDGVMNKFTLALKNYSGVSINSGKCGTFEAISLVWKGI